MQVYDKTVQCTGLLLINNNKKRVKSLSISSVLMYWIETVYIKRNEMPLIIRRQKKKKN